jgi:hypothetical protein
MRELRFVGPGDESGCVVVETVEGDEQFSLQVGEELRSVTDTESGDSVVPEDSEDAGPVPAVEVEPTASQEMTITPREIQVRARGGESAESIAESAGMNLDKVMRFARPVLDERTRITVEARRARARRSTPEGQLVPFGEAVDSRFTAHGIDVDSVDWDAYRRDDGVWVVSASWIGGEAARIARWAVSLTHRLVSPLDETASDLLSDRPIRPVVHVVPTLDDGENLTDPLPVVVEEVFDQEAPPEPVEPFIEPPPPLRLAEGPRHARTGRQQIPAWDDILLGVRRKND